MRKLVIRAFILLVSASVLFSLFFYQPRQDQLAVRRHSAAELFGKSSDRNRLDKGTQCHQPPCSSKYKIGKKVVYQPVIGCAEPNLLTNYTNPCWPTSSGVKIACGARIMLLGFHKCGTSDIEQWFYLHNQTETTNTDYFYDKELSPQCPFHWLEQHQKGKKKIYEDPRLVAYDSCPGCIVVNRVIKERSNYVTLQSAVQFLQYTMLDSSRYIVTMRRPSDRMISHFFYSLQEGDNPFAEYSREQIGNEFFHKVVSNSLKTLTECLTQYGTTVCVLAPQLSPVAHNYPRITEMITQTCYSTHLVEVFKFIPKDLIYFSKLEEYSADEARSTKRIFRFVGLSDTTIRKSDKIKSYAKNALKVSKPVLQDTKVLLDSFYAPFNEELRDLLEDEKWLWS